MTFLVISLVGGLAVGMVLADNGVDEGAVAASDAGNGNGGGSSSGGIGAATAITPGADWFQFLFEAVGTPAVACAGCVPSSAGNSVFAPAPPWDFGLGPMGGVIVVTDAFLYGDAFEVFDNNVSIGQTPGVASGGACGDDPVPCFGDAASSSAEFPLAAGNHSITIVPTQVVAGGAAYFAIKEMTRDTDKPRMPALQQQLDLLGDDGTPDNVRQQAVAQIVQALMAPPIILPTVGDPKDPQMVHDETMDYHNRALLDMEDAIGMLTDVKWDALANPDLRAEANAASAFLESVFSVVVGVAEYVGDNPTDQPNRDLPKQLRGVRELDAPFVPMGPRQTRRFPVERTETCNVGFSEESGPDIAAFEQNACVITKEVFGLKAVLHHKVIPIYQEPWDVRVSPIIGHKVVWFIKFTPAEHIKVISHTLDSRGRVKTRITQYDVLMPGLSKFWSFYPPDVSINYDSYESQ